MRNAKYGKEITTLTGLIGSPVSHSLSPAIHKEGFKKNGMEGYDYVLMDSAEENLASMLENLDERFVGFNVTMPDKLEIMNYLDDLSEEAKAIGAVNTVKVQNGKLTGYNTDGKGFVEALKKQGVEIKAKKILIFGAGGAAKAVGYELEQEGAEVEKLHRPEKEELHAKLMECDIFINASPVGMDGISSPVEDLNDVKKDLFVADLIYKPEATKLLKMAEKKGLKFMNGMAMLYEQANLSFYIWHGVKLS
ncbi:MAG: shikimate dehydrogenase [Lachnospiraceae bacterium]|nr:shikimate dehydrogenase [Lachnospiraceae bacterium]